MKKEPLRKPLLTSLIPPLGKRLDMKWLVKLFKVLMHMAEVLAKTRTEAQPCPVSSVRE